MCIKLKKKYTIEEACIDLEPTTCRIVGPATLNCVKPSHVVGQDEVAKISGGDSIVAHATLNRDAVISFDKGKCHIELGGTPISLPSRETANKHAEDIAFLYGLLNRPPPPFLFKSFVYWKGLDLELKYRGQMACKIGDITICTPPRCTLEYGKQMHRGLPCKYLNVIMEILEMVTCVVNNSYSTAIVVQMVFRLIHNGKTICIGSTTDFEDCAVRLQNHFMFKRISIVGVRWRGKERSYSRWWRKYYKLFRLLGSLPHVCENHCTECVCGADSPKEDSLWAVHKSYDFINTALYASFFPKEEFPQEYLYAFPDYKGKIKLYNSFDLSSWMFPEIAPEIASRKLPWLKRPNTDGFQNYQHSLDEGWNDPLSFY